MEEDNKSIRDLIGRYVNGLYTTNDIDRLRRMAGSGNDREKVEKEMDRVWEEARKIPQSVTRDPLYRKEAQDLLREIRKEKRFSLRTFLRYVAILAVVVSIGIGTKLYLDSPEAAQAEQITLSEVSVDHGEHKRITLPDGTVVTLNAGTSLRYPTEFASGIRLVEMDGEAFFEVRKDESKPFVVRTQQADIKVLGTSFNVKAYPEDDLMAVSVRTGKVEVDMPESIMRLLPDEQLVVNHMNGEIYKKNEDTRKVTSWLQGGLYFNRTSIRGVAHDLERMYDREIVLDPHCVFDEHIYGEHDNKSLESVLNAIQYSTGIRYRKDGNRIVLYK